ncbi:MAG: C25 family cysteine peptidase [Promethearchaeota archaeon]
MHSGLKLGPSIPQPASPEYLIISPNDTWVNNFVEWKTQKGVPTLCANVTWINGNVAGIDAAQRIWNYINQIYTTYTTLTWVLLVGDNSTIPSRYIYLPDTSEWTGLSNTLKPTDFYYSVMDDANWDDDNDGRWGECQTFNVGGPGYDEIGDWQPDVYVGRIPFSDEGNITSILSQTITYERNPTSFSTTGWDSFLLAGAISNYDEEVWEWLNGDYTDEAELSDYINDNVIPNYYRIYRFYENRNYFWNYTATNTFQDLNNTAVISGIDLFSAALINFAGHGSPYDIQRKYDDTLYPYGSSYSISAAGWWVNVSGIAIGDPDNDGYNEIVYTLGVKSGASLQNGTVWFCDGFDFSSQSLIWDLWTFPPPGNPPSFATCVDIGDVWNNGTIAVVVGTSAGSIIIFTYWNNVQWTAYTVSGPEPSDPILCLEVGNADNCIYPDGSPGINTDIAWGHRSGMTFIATVSGGPPIVQWVKNIWNHGQAVYSIDVGDPNDDGLGEVTCGTGYMGAGGRDGDCYMLSYVAPGPWVRSTVDTNVGDFIYGLDTGDAGNDGYNKVVIGLGDGAIYMYESGCIALGFSGFAGGTDAGTKQTVTAAGGNAGRVRSLVVGYIDENNLHATVGADKTSIVAGNRWGGIRKYHADNTSGFIDWYPLMVESYLGGGMNISALDVGELSYTTGESYSNLEIVAGTDCGFTPFPLIYWFEWPYAKWDNMINTNQATSSTATIPSLIYADSCLTGAYDFSTLSLAAAFLSSQSIGYIGAMRISWYYLGPMANSIAWGLNRYMSYAFWQLFFTGTSNYRPGQTLYDSKANYITAYSGSHTQSDWQTYHRKNLLTYALFGDPEVDIYTTNPGTFTVTHPLGVPHNQNATFLVMNGSSPVAGATVCLWDKAGSYYQVATTNTSGYAVFNITAAAMSLVDVTITKHNFGSYVTTIPVAYWVSVSAPTISYNSSTFLLNITTITANCPIHGYLNDISATKHTYTFYRSGTNASSGQLSWNSGSSTWRAANILCKGLPEGTYGIRCYFADSDGIGWVDSATTITIEHHITISTPSISLDATSRLLDITSVIAVCSYTAHDSLDNTEAIIHSYTIYNAATDTATSITGDLLWTGSEWQKLDVDISALPGGTYYVRCTFSDSDVSATQSSASTTFTVAGSIIDIIIDFILDNLLIIAIAVIIIIILVSICLLRRRKSK